MNSKTCELCASPHSLTFHHLIPKRCHKNKWFKKKFTMEDMRTRGIIVCRKCHSFIHKQFSEKQLGREFNELTKLLDEDVVKKHIEWARKQY